MTTSDKRLLSGHVRVGTKQTTKTVEQDEAVQVFVAQDADPRMVNRIVQLCIQHSVNLTYIDTMRNLGKACGIGVGTAMAAVVEE
jgi:large subunit ribosomal protein L7A